MTELPVTNCGWITVADCETCGEWPGWEYLRHHAMLQGGTEAYLGQCTQRAHNAKRLEEFNRLVLIPKEIKCAE